MAQTAEMNSPAAVAARMIGSDAPTPSGETNPTSTMPSATDPAMKLGSPSDSGSPASGPRSPGVASASTRARCASGTARCSSGMRCEVSGEPGWAGTEGCCVELDGAELEAELELDWLV